MLTLVARRLDPPDIVGEAIEPPVIAAIRCIYGVGAEPEATPDGDGLRPVYRVDLPVDAHGLDADDSHEFDAASLLGELQTRARARAWAMRIELDVIQTASGTTTDLFFDPPDEHAQLRLLHAISLPGGGRCLTFGTGLAHTPEAAARLAGIYTFSQRGSDGDEHGTCRVPLGLTEYEFE